MKTITTRQFVDFIWSAAAAVAVVSVMTLGGARAASGSEHAGTSGTVLTVSPDASPDPAVEVKIDNFAFTPGVITVKSGTRVTWINRDDIPHTVDSTQGKFKSAAMDTDDKYEFRFTAPGEYAYYCRMHPKMTGKIVVQP
jgi:plastocyanin